MPITETNYSSFRKRVIYPSIRVGALFLAVLAVGLGSWLETNNSVDSCSFKNSLSFHQVHLFQNISSNLTTPDSVSFGMWKSCYFYSLNCTCTSTNLKYEPDIPILLQTATEHLAIPPESNSTSPKRFAPLIVATVFTSLALVIGFIANSKRLYILRRIICGFVIIAIALTAYVFGSTFKSYQDAIKRTCKDPNNTIYCTKYSIGVEVPVFGVAIGLLVLSFLFWLFSAGLFKLDESEDTQDSEDDDIMCCGCFSKSKPEPEPEPRARKRKQKSNSTLIDQYLPPSQPMNELSAWQEADYYNKNYDSEKAYYDQPQYPATLQQHQKKYANNNSYSTTRGHKSRVTSRHDDMYGPGNPQHYRTKKHGHKKRSSSQPLDPYQQSPRGSNQNLDYYQQDVRHSNQHLGYYEQGTRNYNQPIDFYQQDVRHSNQHIDYYQQDPRYSNLQFDYFQQQQQQQPIDYYQQSPIQQKYKKPHRKSQDSALTFGGDRRRSSTQHYNMDYSRSGGGNKTPTAISPHPLLFNNNSSGENVIRNSFYAMPYEEGSSGSNSSSQYMDKKRSLQKVPILHMPPAGVEHPLNKKVIKDKRIQEYLQQTTPTSSSNSTF